MFRVKVRLRRQYVTLPASLVPFLIAFLCVLYLLSTETFEALTLTDESVDIGIEIDF